MLLLVILSVGLAAAEVADDSDKRTYEVFALEKGIYVHETIQVDPVEGIETINMPAHNGLDAVFTVNDFNKKLTVRAFPDKEVCYATTLDTSQFAQPRDLIDAMDRETDAVWVNTPNHTTTYRVVGAIVPGASFLPAQLTHLCKDWPVYWMVQVVEDRRDFRQNQYGVYITRTQQGETARHRRSLETCPYDLVQSACKLVNRYCHYIRVCTRVWDQATQQDKVECGIKDHRFGKNECCETCCSEEQYASGTSPFCGKMTLADIDCSAGPRNPEGAAGEHEW